MKYSWNIIIYIPVVCEGIEEAFRMTGETSPWSQEQEQLPSFNPSTFQTWQPDLRTVFQPSALLVSMSGCEPEPSLVSRWSGWTVEAPSGLLLLENISSNQCWEMSSTAWLVVLSSCDQDQSGPCPLTSGANRNTVQFSVEEMVAVLVRLNFSSVSTELGPCLHEARFLYKW